MNKLTAEQRDRILHMLEKGAHRDAIADSLGVSRAQVSAIAAHKTMGKYEKSRTFVDGTERLNSSAPSPETLLCNALPASVAAGDLRILEGSIPLGTDVENESVVLWNPIAEQGSANPHVLILGESGYGKSYATSCLVTELVQSAVPSVVFDYGQGFSAASTPEPFRTWAHPVDFELSRDGIAINPLEIFPVDLHGPATVAQRVADTFARVYPRIGVQQHAVIRRAVLELLDEHGIRQYDRHTWTTRPPHFRNLERKLNEYAGDAGTNHRRVALSAASHVSTLFVFDTFRSTGRKLSWNDLFTNRKQTWILQLGGLESSVERTVTEFLLWNLIRFVEAQGPGPLRCFIVLDEAHKISFSPGSPVEKLLREGRKFGLAVILASQQPEDFSSVAFGNTATKIVFQVADDRGAISRQLQRKTKNVRSPSEIYESITTLPRGWAYVVTENMGRVVRIASFEDRIVRWRHHDS